MSTVIKRAFSFLLMSAVTMVIVAMGSEAKAALPGPDGNTYQACLTEDSGPVDGATSCFWDATIRGNGKGTSFFVLKNGNIYYTV